MPIKPENKDRYPKDWKQISERIRFIRAGNKCEVCGVENNRLIRRFGNDWEYWPEGMLSEAYTLDGLTATKVILTVAHLDHIPENCENDNLKAMCQKCHNNYDKEHRKETRKNTRFRHQLKIS